MKSIIQEEKKCYICGKNGNLDPLDMHHVYGGAERNNSEKYGLKVWLCHNNCHLNGVHADANLNRKLKAEIQQIAMEYYDWAIEDFRNIFRRSYI